MGETYKKPHKFCATERVRKGLQVLITHITRVIDTVFVILENIMVVEC